MATFNYKALDDEGKTVKGFIEGDSERQVRSQLRSKQLKPLSVLAVTAQRPLKVGWAGWSGWGRGLKPRDQALLTRQLASLVGAGLPLDEALQYTAKQQRKAQLKAVILQVRSGVLEGKSLSQSMAETHRVFDAMYLALVRAGERAGYLGSVLEQLAGYSESSQNTAQRLKMAMIYPIVLLVVSVSVIAILMTFVVPKLVSMFEQGQRSLPLLTKILIAASDFLQSHGVWLLLGLLVFVVLCRRALQAPWLALAWDKILLRVPVLGHVILQANSARFAATLSLLTASGVPLLESLKIAANVMGNRVLRDACERLVIAVQEGSSLHRAMDKEDIFPPLLVQMVASGEANGALADQLQYAARNQERELDILIGTAMAILEPLTVVFMGALVSLIVMAILLPIFDLNNMI